jgi:hypothetical protein
MSSKPPAATLVENNNKIQKRTANKSVPELEKEMAAKKSDVEEPLLPTLASQAPKDKKSSRNWMLLSLLVLALIGLGGIYGTSFGHSASSGQSSERTRMEEQLQTLGLEWTSLRAKQGHWSGGEYDPILDGFTGRKFQVMKELGLLLSNNQGSAQQILKVLGKPDEISNSSDIQTQGISDASEAGSAGIQGMPGPIVGQEGTAEDSTKPYYLIYHWRGRHDYLWFKVQGPQEHITASGWYHAGE